ncbi:hypothetical protein J5690_09970 [bacterium]|nr:hypothetical protein [bacterium]
MSLDSKLSDSIISNFLAAQKISKQEKREAATQIIMECVNAAQNGLWGKIPVARVLTTDFYIKNMLIALSKVYDIVLDEKTIEEIIHPINLIYPMEPTAKILLQMNFSSTKQKELQEMFSRQENNMAEEMKEKSSSAKVIAFYGCIFMDSFDELLDMLTSDQLNDIVLRSNHLIHIIKAKLSQYR